MSGEWSLNDLYESYESDAYKNDVKALVENFEKMEALELIDNLAVVRQVIQLLEKQVCLASNLFAYSNLKLTVNTTDEVSLQENSRLEKIFSRYAKIQAKLNKFIGNSQVDISQDEHLKNYQFYFEVMKSSAKHILSDEVEEVIATLNMSAGKGWEQLREFLTSTVETTFGDSPVTMSEIRNLAYDKDANIRRQAYEAELAMYESIKEPVAFALNNIKSQVNDVTRLRGYDSALAHALDVSHMERKTLDALIEAIKEALPSFRRYLRHKAKLLGHSSGLPFYDLFAPIGEGNMRQFTIEETRAYLVKHFSKFSQDLADMTDEFFEKKYIDVYPRKGKVGGAFCHNLSAIKQSRILLNFDGSLSSVVTTAHELGHAYHGLHIENHLPLNWDYSMPVAETASTFNEALIMNSIIAEATDEEKISLIESELQDTTQIIVDIYSRYLFESEVFEQRKEKFLFSKDLEAIMLETQRQAYGDGLDENYLHPFMWACKPHYYDTYLSFYNFPYAFGGLFSKGLYAIYQEKPEGFVEKYQKMLHDTTVTTVEDTAKAMEVDVTTKEFWAQGLKQVEKQIDEFIRLTSQ